MIRWEIKKFDELSKNELYAILRFRIDIFMLEQKSFYEDLDNLDQDALHFLCLDDTKIVAYGRVNIDSQTHFAVIRRVCIHKDYRNQKLGVVLMNKMLDKINTTSGLVGAELDAQSHLQKFYEKLGFTINGQPYDDGGVIHIRMTKEVTHG